MSHTDKATIPRAEAVANTCDNNNGVKSESSLSKSSTQDQYEYWARTLSFPSYVIDEYKKKYPTTYMELRIDGLNKQQAARYIYHNCDSIGDNDKIFDIAITEDGPVYNSGFGFIRYLSD